jgi:predicted nuclease of predicted toxin-antitoxin system
MRLLANENLPLDAVEALRSAGHDVAWIRTLAPGIGDPEVLQRALSENRILVTLDKDFGELVYRPGLAPAPGIILLRFALKSPADLAQRVVAALAGRSDWRGHFSVVEEDRVRMTAFPRSAP